jgi:hypothetical protein
MAEDAAIVMDAPPFSVFVVQPFRTASAVLASAALKGWRPEVL